MCECLCERMRPAATAVTVAGRATLRRPEAPRMNDPACGALPSSVKYTCHRCMGFAYILL